MKRYAGIGEPNAYKRALELLRSGGVVVLPTDTLYGFHAALTNVRAIERIRTLKGVSPDHRFVLLVADVVMAQQYVASFGCSSPDELERRWPSRLTVVVPAGSRCPSWIGGTVALRVPDLAVLRELIEALGEPVVSTSVNHTGEPPMDDARDITKRFDVDLVVTGEGHLLHGGASTIVDLCGSAPHVVRQGDYVWAAASGDSNPSK
ncbi:MAG: threonylcarbamoyl-AMP synthase [Candidatus Krumholzibacteriota bacterium]|nr:threonylcarbamoyl-AMP synthase [Candidatus Krumholzibacteriota bacterium]